MLRSARQTVTIACVALMGVWPNASRAEAVTVFAAASLETVITEAARLLEADNGIELRLSIGGSSQLARQIAAGAPADVVILASDEWMGWLEAQNAIDRTTIFDVASNALAVVGPPGTQPAENLADALENNDRIAVALTEEVPAGQYTRQALEAAGLWDTYKSALVQTDHVRAALALVALGAVPRGIVYESDAHAEDKVDLIYTIPQELHKPIRYQAALTSAASPAALQVLTLLSSTSSTALFERHGFLAPVESAHLE